MNAWHDLQLQFIILFSSCSKSHQKRETKKNFNQPKHKAFSAFPRTQVKCEIEQRSVSTCSEQSERTLPFEDSLAIKYLVLIKMYTERHEKYYDRNYNQHY